MFSPWMEVILNEDAFKVKVQIDTSVLDAMIVIIILKNNGTPF